MDGECDYCGKAIKTSFKWKNKVFCSGKCKKQYKLRERENEGGKSGATPLKSGAFDQLYWK
jgi:hypothetical protein